MLWWNRNPQKKNKRFRQVEAWCYLYRRKQRKGDEINGGKNWPVKKGLFCELDGSDREMYNLRQHPLRPHKNNRSRFHFSKEHVQYFGCKSKEFGVLLEPGVACEELCEYVQFDALDGWEV